MTDLLDIYGHMISEIPEEFFFKERNSRRESPIYKAVCTSKNVIIMWNGWGSSSHSVPISREEALAHLRANDWEILDDFNQ